MRSAELSGAGIVACCLLATACGNYTINPGPSACGTPPATATPVPAFLNYPPNGSTNVPTSVGQIIETGASPNGPVPMAITLEAIVTQSIVVLGTPTSVPSPLPSPFLTPPSKYANESYVAIPVPTLSPGTLYRVSDVFVGWAALPPCATGVSQTLGTFSTGSI